MTVERCERSTLREAWLGIFGLPGPLEPAEAAALGKVAERSFGPLRFEGIGALLSEHAQALAQPASDTVPPLWFQQATWRERRWALRFGHRMFTLHRMLAADERYSTFEGTMAPTLEKWLGAAADAYAFLGEPPGAATVVFAYHNHFELPSEGLDLSEWFRFNFGVDAAGADDGLVAFEIAARVERDDGRTVVRLGARSGDDDRVVVTVETRAERDLPDGATFGQPDVLREAIDQTRHLARETFFSFVTDKTLDHMEAVRAGT